MMIYFDNAATSWPKPEEVYDAADTALRKYGGNPGRGSHRMSLEASELLYDARLTVARFFHAEKPENICFTSNATEALNLAIKGILGAGDHVIASSAEHNSVTRPLKKLEKNKVEITKVTTSPSEGIDLRELEQSLRPNTRMVICNHISNVTGTINPIREIGQFCRKNNILFLLDAAQSAGTEIIDVQENFIDLLAFPGHKGLMGPPGSGGLYIREGIDPAPLKEGGTGTHSEWFEQPKEKPERYESGTPNLPGIAGMAAGIKYIQKEGINKIKSKETELTNQLLKGLSQIPGLRLYGPNAGAPRGGVVSFTLENLAPGDISAILDSSFLIAVRSGLHCARDAHETIGTLETGGVVRISPGYFNTSQDIDYCIDALRRINEGE